MSFKSESRPLLWVILLFAGTYFLPVESTRFQGAVSESLALVKWYAREHVILCLIPAFFIAGAIGVFIHSGAVMKHLGAGANKIRAYGVASVSGSVLAVCSCTVLPLFSGIYRMGAGLGPATAFLYAGPAINVLAMILTARVLGMELGVARVIGAVLFSIVIGLLMAAIFRKEEEKRVPAEQDEGATSHSTWATVFWFATMITILVSANWSKGEGVSAGWALVYENKWRITSLLALLLGVQMIRMLQVTWWSVLLSALAVIAAVLVAPEHPEAAFLTGAIALSIVLGVSGGEGSAWLSATWDFAKMILPLLLFGIIAAGFFMGGPNGEGIIPPRWIESWVGGNGFFANFFASVAGALMYFATLTEIPIMQGLLNSGMGKGPALALLLAGPALSLPSMLVLNKIMGFKKTIVFILLVVAMATLTGWVFGLIE
jgi:uncharacterized membrane protein YraQ (UPF0718 family)